MLQEKGAYEGWEGSEWHKNKDDRQIDSSDEHDTFTALLQGNGHEAVSGQTNAG